MKPRYMAGAVTGWPINEAELNRKRDCPPSGREAPTIAYVYDSARCFEVVWEFRHGFDSLSALQCAERYADLLNEEEDQWLLSQSTSIPGTS